MVMWFVLFYAVAFFLWSDVVYSCVRNDEEAILYTCMLPEKGFVID